MTRPAPRFSQPLTRATRRLLVVVAAVAVALALSLTQVDGVAANLAFYGALVAWVVITVRVDRALHGLPGRPERRLDERELSLRNATYHRAYRIITGLGIALLLSAVAVTEWTQRTAATVEPERALLLMLVLYVTVVLNLPWMALAWRLPDPVDEGAA